MSGDWGRALWASGVPGRRSETGCPWRQGEGSRRPRAGTCTCPHDYRSLGGRTCNIPAADHSLCHPNGRVSWTRTAAKMTAAIPAMKKREREKEEEKRRKKERKKKEEKNEREKRKRNVNGVCPPKKGRSMVLTAFMGKRCSSERTRLIAFSSKSSGRWLFGGLG